MSPRTLLSKLSTKHRKVTWKSRSFVPTQVGLAALEVRLVQSTAVLAQGVLTVTGTPGNDTIKVIESTTSLTADGKAFAVGSVNSIVVNGLDGNDTISVTSKKPATLNGGAGNDTLTATSGKDTLLGGDGVNSYAGSYYTDMITDPILTGGRSMEKMFMDYYQYDGGLAGYHGAPLGDEHQAGWVSWVDFKNGTVITSPGGGMFEIHGAILAKYVAMGGGASFLGLPIANQVTSKVGSACEFQGGTLVSPVSGGQAFEVHGAIRDKYYALGGGDGVLGLPTSDETTSGVAKVNHFQNGSIYWSGQPGDTVGAHVLYGTIRDKYVAMGGAASFLGLPLGDELSSPAGRCYEFQGGIIVSSASRGPAYEVHGLIKDKYYALGGGAGLLGIPTSDVHQWSDGTSVQSFQGGEVLFRSDIGIHLFFTRNEVIAALKRSQLDGKLDSGEFSFFQGIARDTSIYVDSITRALTSNLIDGDPANARFQGLAVGNLYANCSSVIVDRLEQKWFEGLDHPGDTFNRTNPDKSVTSVNGGAYSYVAGPLFGPNGPAYGDIDQGNLGDCYFLASLAETAFRSPATIRGMFTDNGDGTYTVQFHRGNGDREYVTVDRMLPSGGGAFAQTGVGSVWVALAEKAYAQINEEGWLPSSNKGTNNYGSIEGGLAENALNAVTGSTATSGTTDIAADWAAGKLVVLDTGSKTLSYIVSSHTYAVVAYDASTRLYTLFNPWGLNNGTAQPGLINETLASIKADFVRSVRTGSASVGAASRTETGKTILAVEVPLTTPETGTATDDTPVVVHRNVAHPRGRIAARGSRTGMMAAYA